MSAIWAIGTNFEGATEVGVVADKRSALYITAPGVEDFYTERLDDILSVDGVETPSDPDGWIDLATQHLNHINWRVMGDAKNRSSAKAAVKEYIKETANDLPQSRATAMTAIETAYADFDIELDEDDIDDDDELDAMLELAGGVDPDVPHMWLPPYIGAAECIFCEKIESDTIHPIDVTMPGNVDTMSESDESE